MRSVIRKGPENQDLNTLVVDAMNIEITELENHLDQRGVLTEIFRENGADHTIKQVYFTISSPGAVRGNHYHLRKTEWLAVVRGSAKLVCEDPFKKTKEELMLSGDEPKAVRISPLISHAVKNVGQEDLYLIVAGSEVFDPGNPDVQRDNLL